MFNIYSLDDDDDEPDELLPEEELEDEEELRRFFLAWRSLAFLRRAADLAAAPSSLDEDEERFRFLPSRLSRDLERRFEVRFLLRDRFLRSLERLLLLLIGDLVPLLLNGLLRPRLKDLRFLLRANGELRLGDLRLFLDLDLR